MFRNFEFEYNNHQKLDIEPGTEAFMFGDITKVKDSHMAALYLNGYAQHLQTLAKHEDMSEGESLKTAMDNVRFMAGFHVTGERQNEKMAAIMAPFDTALQQLTQAESSWLL